MKQIYDLCYSLRIFTYLFLVTCTGTFNERTWPSSYPPSFDPTLRHWPPLLPQYSCTPDAHLNVVHQPSITDSINPSFQDYFSDCNRAIIRTRITIISPQNKRHQKATQSANMVTKSAEFTKAIDQSKKLKNTPTNDELLEVSLQPKIFLRLSIQNTNVTSCYSFTLFSSKATRILLSTKQTSPVSSISR